jgi:hypothetical protein
MTTDKTPDQPGYVTRDMFNELQLEVMYLKAEVARLRAILDTQKSAESAGSDEAL